MVSTIDQRGFAAEKEIRMTLPQLDQLRAAAASGALDGPLHANLRALLSRLEVDAAAEREWTALGEWQAKQATKPIDRVLSHDASPGDLLVRAPHGFTNSLLGTLREGGREVRFFFPARSTFAFVPATLLPALLATIPGYDAKEVRSSTSGVDPNNLSAALVSMGLGEMHDVASAVKGLQSSAQAARWYANETDHDRRRTIKRVAIEWQLADPASTPIAIEAEEKKRAADKVAAAEQVAHDRELLMLALPADRGAA
jgi:hypothetical protein